MLPRGHTVVQRVGIKLALVLSMVGLLCVVTSCGPEMAARRKPSDATACAFYSYASMEGIGQRLHGKWFTEASRFRITGFEEFHAVVRSSVPETRQWRWQPAMGKRRVARTADWQAPNPFPWHLPSSRSYGRLHSFPRKATNAVPILWDLAPVPEGFEVTSTGESSFAEGTNQLLVLPLNGVVTLMSAEEVELAIKALAALDSEWVPRVLDTWDAEGQPLWRELVPTVAATKSDAKADQ